MLNLALILDLCELSCDALTVTLTLNLKADKLLDELWILNVDEVGKSLVDLFES